jgi:hypothetical protein
MIGIYQIKNLILERVYIGSSIYPDERLVSHKANLKRGKHPIKDLQDDWNNQSPKDFVFEVIQWIDCNVNSRDLRRMEHKLVRELDPYYNTFCKKRKVNILH